MNNLLSSSAARLRDAALVAALVASGVLAGAGQAKADKLDDILSSGTLRCGVMLDYPPLGYRDSNGDPQGFDVETCKDIATAMGVELEIIETPAPQRIPSLIAGTTDIAVAGTTATLERAKTVTFTRPYNMGRMFVAYKQDSGEMTQFEDLKGKTVAVVRGTINETAYLAECAKWDEGCDNLSLATNADAVTALRQGRADAIYDSTPGAVMLLEKVADTYEVVGEEFEQNTRVGMAFRKGETEVKDAVAAALDEIVADGTYDALVAKWNLPASVSIFK